MGGVALLSRKPPKRGKIGPMVLFMTNRKLHTRFRLVPKSTTLDDLEGHYAMFQNTCVFRRPPRKSECENLTHTVSHEDVAHDSIIWQYKVCGDIFAGVPWREGVSQQWDNRKRRFSLHAFVHYVFGTLRNEANITI